MSSFTAPDRDAVAAALDGLDAAFDVVANMWLDRLSHTESLGVLERLEVLARRWCPGTRSSADWPPRPPKKLGGHPTVALADRLRIAKPEARRRMDTAADLGPRAA